MMPLSLADEAGYAGQGDNSILLKVHDESLVSVNGIQRSGSDVDRHLEQFAALDPLPVVLLSADESLSLQVLVNWFDRLRNAGFTDVSLL